MEQPDEKRHRKQSKGKGLANILIKQLSLPTKAGNCTGREKNYLLKSSVFMKL